MNLHCFIKYTSKECCKKIKLVYLYHNMMVYWYNFILVIVLNMKIYYDVSAIRL